MASHMPDGSASAPVTQLSSPSANDPQSAYNDLKRLIPSLALELDHLRAALREHNLWLQRYGHSGNNAAADPYAPPPAAGGDTGADGNTPTATPTTTGAAADDSELPAYSASDVPPYRGGPNSVSSSTSTREQVQQRRNELTEWLREGEDVLREYSARYSQLSEELQMPPGDLLGTWNEASPDNALPDYERIETREELMVGGVGEVPPPYVRGSAGR